jgi:RNA polymerase sigma factor (sigma-70 family)
VEGNEIAALTRGEKGAWEAFVRRYARLVLAAVRPFARDEGEADDLVQDVFARLCRDEFRLLKSYDPARAGVTTWLTVVARSTARDATRRRRLASVPLEDAPESAVAVDPVEPAEPLKLPLELLSPRQREVLSLMYDREMEVAEVAASLGIDAQTVRSMHHKAMVKLRAFFGVKP